MQTKHLMQADEYQYGDVFHAKREDPQMWGYYWRDYEGNWIATSWMDMQYSSKDAAKRAVSRMIRKYPKAWENVEFLFVRFADS
jgi:hypothetical protein